MITPPYERPTGLGDPYREYSAEELRKIIETPDELLDARQFGMIFHGGLAAGYYEESCYFLPSAFKYVTDRRQDHNEVLAYLIYWCRVFCERLVKDGIWEQVDGEFFDIFLSNAAAFELPPEDSRPKNWEVVEIFLEEFNNRNWNDQEFRLYPEIDLTPYRLHCDAYLARRLAARRTFDDWAWLVYFASEHARHGATGCVKSEYLERLVQDKTWHAAAEEAIIERVLAHPEEADFWSWRLDALMIF